MPRLLLLVPTTSYRTEEFTQAARELALEVTLASEEASSLGAARPHDLIRLPLDRPELAADEAEEFARSCPLDAVLGVDDASVEAAAAIARRLGFPHNPPEAVRRSRNKHSFRLTMAEAGLPGPRFQLVHTGAAWNEFPCVLKPLSLSGSRGVIRADNPEEFAAARTRIETLLRRSELGSETAASADILVESFLPGREIALEGLLTHGELRILCFWEKPDPLDGPYFPETIYLTPARLTPEERDTAGSAAQAATRALGLAEGPIHAEMRLHEGRAVLLELNPRSIGGRCARALRFGAGISLENLILRHALGMALPPFQMGGAAGVVMLNPPSGGRLVEIAGQEAAKSVPGIEELILTAHRGQVVEPLPEGAAYAGFIIARGETVEAVERSLRTALGELQWIIDGAGYSSGGMLSTSDQSSA